MHCDPTANWPTPAVEALTTAFPDLITEVNNNGLTAQQTFEQDIDTEEAVTDKSPATSLKKAGRRGNDNDQFQDNTAAARAAAIAHSKKKVSKSPKESSGMAPYVWVALIFAILAILSTVFSS